MRTENQIRDEVKRTRAHIQELKRDDFFDPVYPTQKDKDMLLMLNKRQLNTLLWVLEEGLGG